MHMTASTGSFGMLVLEINVCLIRFSRAFQISFLFISPVSPLSSCHCLWRLCEALKGAQNEISQYIFTPAEDGLPCAAESALCCSDAYSPKKRHHKKSTQTRRNPAEVLNFYKRDTEAFLSQHFYDYTVYLPLSPKAFLESFGKNESLSHIHQLSDTFKIMCLFFFWNWELLQINVFSLKDLKYLIIPRCF